MINSTPTKSSPSSSLSPSSSSSILQQQSPLSSSSPRMTTIVSSAPIIKKLPKHVQDSLKSGTNISCLSDCVKELIENAIDAKATNIEIQLQGHSSLTIKDNGHGIHQDNFETLCKRYYTHKFNHFNSINTTTSTTHNNNNNTHDDHQNNNNTTTTEQQQQQQQYYGYKGEALNSICNLSKEVHIKTKYGDDSELGTYLVYDTRGEMTSKTLIRMNRGTIITINELFSTIPVRRKCFMSSIETQINQLVTTLKQLTLIHFNIRFSLKNFDSCKFTKNANIKNMKQSMNTIFGMNLFDHLYYYSNHDNDHDESNDTPIMNALNLGNREFNLQIHVPNYESIVKSNQQQQQSLDNSNNINNNSTIEREVNKFFTTTKPFIYVNSRMIVKYEEIQKAMREIFSNFFKTKSNIFYVLIIEMSEEHFDVSINPNKTRMISSLNDKIKKELQQNIVKYYADENTRLNKNVNNNNNMDDDDDVIDNNLNNSSILLLNNQSNNQSGIIGANKSMILSSPNNRLSPSLNQSPIVSRSTSGTSGGSIYRTPNSATSNSSTPQSNYSGKSSNSNITPSPPIFNKRTVIISGGGNSNGSGYSHGNYSSNINNNGNVKRGKNLTLDDSLLDTLENMDDIIGIPILPKNNNTTSTINGTDTDSMNVNNNNTNINNNISTNTSATSGNGGSTSGNGDSEIDSSTSTASSTSSSTIQLSRQSIDVNKFKSTTPNNSKKRKTIQTKLTLESSSLHGSNSRNIEIENLNEEMITKKRKLYASHVKCRINFNQVENIRISKNDIFDEMEIIGELENRIGIIYHKRYHKVFYLNLNTIRSDCIFNNLMNSYSFKDSIIPLQQPINLLLCKNELSNKNLKSICVKPEYQEIFEMNGFKIEFEKQPLENEPNKKKITKLNLIGIINSNSFGTREHYNYGLQDFIEMLQNIERFEKDLLPTDAIRNILREKKATKTDLIAVTAIQFRPNTMIEHFKSTAKHTSSSLIGDRKSIHEILVELKNTCFFKLHQFISQHAQGEEDFNELIYDITAYFHPLNIDGSSSNSNNNNNNNNTEMMTTTEEELSTMI